MTASQRTLEVIITDAAEAMLAERAGANRLELVAARGRGGLSPSLETVGAVLDAVTIPVHAIVRVHDESFCYDMAAREAMLKTAEQFAALGVHGLVVGALLPDADIDTAFLCDVIDRAGAAELTFHRAFDQSADLRASYSLLGRFPQVTRVLTAGAAPDAWTGRAFLRELSLLSKAPAILAGGGITPQNAREVIAATGVTEVHVGNGARTDGQLDAQKISALAAALRKA